MLTFIKKITLVTIVSVSMIACTKNESSVVAPLTANVVKDLAADTVLGIASNGMPYSAGTVSYTHLTLPTTSRV